MPTITVDGQSYQVAEGRTLLQALDDRGVLMNGVDIPHYCWHPKLSIDGSCRLCQVEIEGMPKLQIACDTLVQDGMVVHTQNERVQQARQGVMELLLVNHPLDCPICDQAGECKLQDYAFEYGVQHARTEEPRRAAKKRVELGPTILFDQERCILCRRCVRFCREVPKTGELAVYSRGDRSVIETFPETQLDNDYSMNVADICPVGALTTRDFRFKIRVWFLEDVPGVCTGCSQGCNVSIGVANNRAYRYVPRRNDEVNETWICDEGRMSYARINADDRIQLAQVRDTNGDLQETAVDDAIEEAARRLREVIDRDGAVGVWASPHATNEDLFVASRLAAGLGAPTGFAVARGREDDLLIRAEKAANATGAALTAGLVADLDALRALDTLVLLDTHHSAIEGVAAVILPARHAAEKLGTLTNHRGHVQRVVPAVEPAFDARDEGEICWALGAALGLDGFVGSYDPVAVSKALAGSVAAYAGADVESVGDSGHPANLQPADGEA
jgi:NADH-quinone oxidoreductase subunit G